MRQSRFLAAFFTGALAVSAGCSANSGAHEHVFTSATIEASTVRDAHDEEPDDDEEEIEVALSAVPQLVKDAALAAVPGLQLSKAEKETAGDRVVYCLEGSARGVAYEVEVTAAGKVVEIEQGDEAEDPYKNQYDS